MTGQHQVALHDSAEFRQVIQTINELLSEESSRRLQEYHHEQNLHACSIDRPNSKIQ
jgi:hypothetical protein